MDKNDDGDLSISELLPLVFSKATKEQLRSVLYYCQREIVCKKDKSRGRKILEPEDLDELFNIYDSELVGFVAVGTIKDRVRGMELPRQAEEFILRSIAGTVLMSLLHYIAYEPLCLPSNGWCRLARRRDGEPDGIPQNIRGMLDEVAQCERSHISAEPADSLEFEF